MKIERQEQKFVKEKAHVKQLLKVIAMYESMVPLARNIDSYDEKRQVSSKKQQKKVDSAFDDDDDDLDDDNDCGHVEIQ